MKRGGIYRIKRPTKQDPKRFRAYIIVSRQALIETVYDTLICAPIYTNPNGLPTEVYVGIDDGLKRESCIRCDELISIHRSKLTDFIGSLSPQKMPELDQALKVALEIEN
ncbi:MAG: type II toxin-antitoxin system PemK/MazF family toxin [Pyrinomonadaceae bacterium]